MVYKKQIHKVKKNEKLADIPKKYKHKDWKDIWKAPENKRLASKRKKPDQLEPGDVLTIPFNAAQWTEITNEIAGWQAMMAADTELLDYFESSRANSEITIKKVKDLVVYHEKWIKTVEDYHQKANAEAKKWTNAVDAIATVTQLVFNLGKMAKAGLKASKSVGQELAKLNGQVTKDVVNLARDPIAKEARKAGAKHAQDAKNGFSLVVGGLGVISDSFDRMSAPSFWAWTACRLVEGDSWSDATAYDFKKETKKTLANLTKDTRQKLAKLKQSIAGIEALIGGISKERNNALGRIADAEKSLKVLEKLY